jgi:hypothetical protein
VALKNARAAHIGGEPELQEVTDKYGEDPLFLILSRVGAFCAMAEA